MHLKNLPAGALKGLDRMDSTTRVRRGTPRTSSSKSKGPLKNLPNAEKMKGLNGMACGSATMELVLSNYETNMKYVHKTHLQIIE